MARIAKRNSGLYGFLESVGALDTSDADLIQAAKNRYWAEYKRNWKQAKRHESKTISILYSPKEAKRIATAAERTHSNPTAFVKEAALAASEGRQMANAAMVGEIRQLLALEYSLLQEAAEEGKVPEETGNSLLERMASLERQVLELIKPSKRI